MADLLVVALLLAGGFWVARFAERSWSSRNDRHVPPEVVVHSAAEKRQVADYHRLLRSAVHAIEGVLLRDEQLPFLSADQRTEMERVVEEWGKL